MIYQQFDPKLYQIGASNGTTSIPQANLGGTEVFINIESVAMLGQVSLRDAPSRSHHADESVRPEVSASIERSLKENAGVWAELAKH